jgi:hypothetical protein
MTQGKIERWHQTLKGRILLENYFLPGDLEAQIAAFVTDYNYCRYDDESIDNLTPAGGFNHPTNIRFGPDGCAYVWSITVQCAIWAQTRISWAPIMDLWYKFQAPA